MKFSTLVTKSDLAAARKVEPLVMAELERHGYSEEAVFAVRLALEEALANAINHGNARDASKAVRVDYHIDPRRAVIRVSDEGPGFSRGSVPDPTAPENIEKPCGRGIMLMEAYMNEVRWNRDGNCVELIKKNE
ncbi:MAG: Serine-protein kinase RsbW [Phycisphaerae bacterium]|nr:Serine-protein kinase RsbW [Phycisphaerae bacterium]